MSIKSIEPPLIINLPTDVGSIGGGWLCRSRLLRQVRSANAERKTAMLVRVICLLPVRFALVVDKLWVAISLIGLAALGTHAPDEAREPGKVPKPVPIEDLLQISGASERCRNRLIGPQAKARAPYNA